MKQKVLRVKQSPLNKLEWHCDLACGHSEWVTSKRKPHTVNCHAEHPLYSDVACTCPKSDTGSILYFSQTCARHRIATQVS